MKRFLFVIIMLYAISCNRTAPVKLNIYFSPLDSVVYRLTYNSGGEYHWEDSSSDLSTTIECYLIGKHVRNNPGKMNVTVESTNVLTNVLDTFEVFNMNKRLEEGEFQVSFTEAGFNMADLDSFPIKSPEEHGFVRQLMKLTPSLPLQPVKPGYSWERELMYPVQSSAGTIPCSIYRSYSFDSLSSVNNSLAYVSWKFRYRLDQKSVDTTSAVFLMPMSGRGSGNAVIDTDLHKLKNSEIQFVTDEVQIVDMKLKWKEKAVMVMEDENEKS